MQQEHQLEDSKGRPWIWLRVRSRAKEGKALPLFYDRDTVAGEVEVDFDKAGGAKTVVVSVSTPLCCHLLQAVQTKHVLSLALPSRTRQS